MPRLIIESGIDSGMIYILTEPITTLGRSPANTIQIFDRKVSRYHAEIHHREQEFLLRDLGSKNGTYVNEQLITADYKLQNNDRLRIGDTVFSYEVEAEPEAEKETTTRAIRLVSEPLWGETKETISVSTKPEMKFSLDIPAGALIKDGTFRLEILYQVDETIRNILNINDLLNKILEIIFNVLQPERGCILLKDEKTQQFIPRVVKTLENEEITLSRHIVERCVKEKLALLISDASSDERFKEAESVLTEQIKSAICSPMVFKDEVIGIIYVDTKSRQATYGKEEMELLTGISNRAAMAIVNARLHERLVEQSKLEKELEIARTIQMNLLPHSYPAVKNFEIAATSLPAKKVGGDYYDFIELPDGQLGIAVGDVSGKGIPAAILIATVRALLKSEATRPRASLTSIISKVNNIICHDITGDMFITLVFVVLNPQARSLEYTNAGHCHPLLFDPHGKITSLNVGGSFLGLISDAEYRKDSLKFPAGSILVLYTDGVTDTMDEAGNLFGLEQLKKIILENRNKSAILIRDAVMRELDKFRGKAEVFDDLILVVIKSL